MDLGDQPPSNAYLTRAQVELPEITYPLRAYVCRECWLVQLPTHVSAADLFTEDYAYFSSVSSSWVEHARKYAEMIISRLKLGTQSFVVEVASNDGYLLQFFAQSGIPCVGVEPTASTAYAAREKGIETIEVFFGNEYANQLRAERGPVDLLIGNNVLAHVPDLNDFVSGISAILAADGVATLEFPHLMQMVTGIQFDTIYHEHYSYFSLQTVIRVATRHGLRIFDVEELETHGGSLRVYVAKEGSSHQESSAVERVLETERNRGMTELRFYQEFQPAVDRIRNQLLQWLHERKANGDRVVGYGAAAKGNTLLNYAGVRRDLLPYVCDAAKSKQSKFLPGSHIPIVAPDVLLKDEATHLLLLPRNIERELRKDVRNLGAPCKYTVTAIPFLKMTPLHMATIDS